MCGSVSKNPYASAPLGVTYPKFDEPAFGTRIADYAPTWADALKQRSAQINAVAPNPPKSTYYVIIWPDAQAIGWGGYVTGRGVSSGNNFSRRIEEAKRFPTMKDAVQYLQIGGINSADTIVRVEETTMPGTKKLSVSSTLEPSSPSDRFVVVYRNTDLKAEFTDGNSISDSGLNRDSINSARVIGSSFATQIEAVKAAANREFLPEQKFVGIRRLIMEQGEPTVKRTETVVG